MHNAFTALAARLRTSPAAWNDDTQTLVLTHRSRREEPTAEPCRLCFLAPDEHTERIEIVHIDAGDCLGRCHAKRLLDALAIRYPGRREWIIVTPLTADGHDWWPAQIERLREEFGVEVTSALG